MLPALLLFASIAAAADPPQTTLRWHGHSFFELETAKGTKIVFDPHFIEAYGRKQVAADLVLSSHPHTDHTQLEPIVNKMQAKVIQGVKGDLRKQDWAVVDEAFRDARIRTVATYHDDVKGMERGKNAIFIVDVDGLRIVHLGDLGHALSDADVKRIGTVDVLLVPVGGVYTLNGAEAKKVVGQIKPRQYILPMHFGTPVFMDLLTAAEFLEDQKNVKKVAGNKLTLSSDFRPPEPVIALLDFK